MKGTPPHHNDVTKHTNTLFLSTAIALLCLSHNTLAQSNSDVEEVIVTGSLISKPSVFDGRAPVQSLDAEALRSSGVTQTSDSLKNLTVNSGSTLAIEQSEAQGTSQFSLRGLGLGSSLTLINGRRAGVAPITNGAGNFFFDINSLPVTMIQRIDVLTDGASATYGSEAVAGVANIITRSGFEGFEITAGASDASNTSYDFGFALGSAGERGHFNVFGAYYKQDHNFRTDFDWVVERVTDPNGDGSPLDGRHISGTGSPGSYRRAVEVSPGSGIFERLDGATQVADADCEAAGGFLDGNTCRMLFADQRTIIPDEERFQIFAEANYQFTDQVEFFSEISFSVNEVTDRIGAFVFDNGNLAEGEGFLIPADHPFNFWTDDDNDGVLTYIDPSEWDPNIHTAVALAATARPLGNEVNGAGAADLEREFRNTRILTGLNLELPGSWSATTSWMYANNQFTEVEPHNYIVDQFTALVASGRWNPFGTRLSNPGLVTPKFLDASNPNFGATAANSADVQSLFDGFGVQSRETETSVVEFIASGDAFDFASQAVPVAVGVQYRNLEYTRTPDSLEAAQEGNRGAREFRVSGRQDVYAIFAEALLTFGDVAEVQLAARYEDYGSNIDTFDPKISAKLRINDQLSFRGSWGTSFQAPSLTQVAGEQTFGTLSDARDDNGLCDQNANENNNTIQRRVGSDGLAPQNATNYNLGILFTPTDELQFGLDYWNYVYEDLIGLDSNAQTIVDLSCRNEDGTFRQGLPPRQISSLVRNSAGQPVSTTSNFINIGEVEAAGIDLNASYFLNTDNAGQLIFDLKATYITKFDADVDGDGIFEDRKGFRNSDLDAFAPQPELRWVASTTWNFGNSSANIALRFIDEFVQDQGTDLDPSFDPLVDSWTTLDASYTYTFSQLVGDGDTTLSIGANNITDEDPPELSVDPGSNEIIRPGYEGTIHDIRGRQVFIKVKHSF
ncbi:TonB-dependent receptor plug domain-containing protein [Agarilytica rhodophyticola]|uniref:TonB-dependent receptor plug domain-containing protein n=1 Tax=Agarilytica rhodophyticola TaxID=1737490 RepID=UPI00131A08E7|nr:TonB-dependent receptor [Agarilytica rhodophyticola]